MKSSPGVFTPTTVTPYLERTWDSASVKPTHSAGGYIFTIAKSSSNSMKSSMRPFTRWAARTPASCSGKITWFAPIRLRIVPCASLIAFTQMCGISRSTRFTVISTDASMEVPTPTTAVEKSCAPSWRRASESVASASTTWVSEGA